MYVYVSRTSIKRFKVLPADVANPAQRAQPPLQVGDLIVGVNGVPCESFSKVVEAIRASPARVTLDLFRAPPSS